MFHCNLCGTAAHARSSRYITRTTKERHHQCQNINCGHTFVTMETVARSIVTPGVVVPVQPHQPPSGQQTMWM